MFDKWNPIAETSAVLFMALCFGTLGAVSLWRATSTADVVAVAGFVMAAGLVAVAAWLKSRKSRENQE